MENECAENRHSRQVVAKAATPGLGIGPKSIDLGAKIPDPFSQQTNFTVTQLVLTSSSGRRYRGPSTVTAEGEMSRQLFGSRWSRCSSAGRQAPAAAQGKERRPRAGRRAPRGARTDRGVHQQSRPAANDRCRRGPGQRTVVHNPLLSGAHLATGVTNALAPTQIQARRLDRVLTALDPGRACRVSILRPSSAPCDSLMGFASYDEPFDTDSRLARDDANAGTPSRAYLSPTLKFKAGPIVGSAGADFEWWRSSADQRVLLRAHSRHPVEVERGPDDDDDQRADVPVDDRPRSIVARRPAQLGRGHSTRPTTAFSASGLIAIKEFGTTVASTCRIRA